MSRVNDGARKTPSPDIFSDDYQNTLYTRGIYWSGLILLLVAAAALTFAISAVIQYQDVAAWVSLVALVGEVIAIICAMFLARRGRLLEGGWLLILAFAVAQTVLAAMVPGLGLPISLAVLIAVPIMASQFLPQRWMALATVVGIVSGFSAAVLSVFVAPSMGIAPAEVVTATPFIAGGLILLLVLYVFVQFRNLPYVSKFVTLFLLIALLPGLGLALLAQVSTTRSITENVGNNLFNIAQAQAGALSDNLTNQLDRLSSYALSEGLQVATAEATGAYRGSESEISGQIAAKDDQWTAAVLKNDLADPLIVERTENQVSEQLLRFQASFPDHVEVFLTDRYGALLGTTDVTSDFDQSDEEWWVKAYNGGSGGVYLSSPEYDASTGQMSILMAVPVISSEDGTVTGVLRSTYRFSALTSLLSSSETWGNRRSRPGLSSEWSALSPPRRKIGAG